MVLVCQVVTVAPPLRAVNAMIRVAVKVLVCFMPSFVCGVSPAMVGSRGAGVFLLFVLGPPVFFA